MNLEGLYVFLGLLPAIILLIFPKIDRVIKRVLVSLVGALWVYISIIFLTIHYIYIINDQHGVLFLISMIGGLLAALLVGIAILIFLISKETKIKNISNSSDK